MGILGFPNRHPWIWAGLILMVVGIPEWLSSVWSLFSSEPFAVVLANKFPFHLPDWSPYWITASIGSLMYVYLMIELIWSRKGQANPLPPVIEKVIFHSYTFPITVFVLAGIFAILLWVLSGKVNALRYAIDCFVMPRHLTNEQITKIAEYLSRNAPSDIELYQVEHDEEAGAYRADFYNAIKAGGWKILQVHVIPEAQVHSDLHIQFDEPLQTSPQTSPPEEDPKHPRPHTILQQAFQYAGVSGGSSGNGASLAFQKYSLALTIGHRRRDSYACEEAQKRHHKEILIRELSR